MNNQFPERKPQRLDGYDYTRAGSYYITVCTKNRCELFWTGETEEITVGNGTRYIPKPELSECGLIAEKYILGIRGIDRYVIMPNHVHMIIRFEKSGEHDLRTEMRSFKSLVSKEIGEPVWQKGYFDRVIRGEAEYRKYAEYIADNPVNWLADEYK